MSAEPAVPRNNRERFDALVGLTDAFCDRHLGVEYKQLCREMAVILCDEEARVSSGKAESWAAGIVSALGFVNFLGDPATEPYMRQEDVARGLGVSPATMHARARVIRERFGLIQLDPNWCLPSLIDENPMVWMLKVNGMIVDIRAMPREVQQVAYEQGLIPYIPADREGEAGGAPEGERGSDA